jgi:hypothetical protein
MAMYLALLYYERDQYWDEPREMEFAPEYTEFARRATDAGVMRGGEALHPVAMSTTITVPGGKGGKVMLVDGPYASVGTSCSRRPTSTKRSDGPRRFRRLGTGGSSCGRSRPSLTRTSPLS